jgi:hypothetical protein
VSPAPASPSRPIGSFALILLSTILFEGGIFLALCAWQWQSRHFPTRVAPWMIHPLSRALCSSLGILDLWAACDLLAQWMIEPEELGMK